MKDDSKNVQIAMTLIKQRNEVLHFSVSGKLVDITWFRSMEENKCIALGKLQISGSDEALNLIFLPDSEDTYEFLLFVGSPMKVHLDWKIVNLESIDDIAFIVKKVEEL